MSTAAGSFIGTVWSLCGRDQPGGGDLRDDAAATASGRGSPLGGHLADTELLEEQQAVGVSPVFGELAVGDARVPVKVTWRPTALAAAPGKPPP